MRGLSTFASAVFLARTDTRACWATHGACAQSIGTAMHIGYTKPSPGALNLLNGLFASQTEVVERVVHSTLGGSLAMRLGLGKSGDGGRAKTAFARLQSTMNRNLSPLSTPTPPHWLLEVVQFEIAPFLLLPIIDTGNPSLPLIQHCVLPLGCTLLPVGGLAAELTAPHAAQRYRVGAMPQLALAVPLLLTMILLDSPTGWGPIVKVGGRIWGAGGGSCRCGFFRLNLRPAYTAVS
jgi:hypothetical protein